MADFFYAWQAPILGLEASTTRSDHEVQHADPSVFSSRLQRVLDECARVLRPDGLLVFSYHHSRAAGWASLARALTGAKFDVVALHPILSEMLAAAPKRQAIEPIQIDLAVVCRRRYRADAPAHRTAEHAIKVAQAQAHRLNSVGLALGRGDIRVLLIGQGLIEATSGRASDTAAFVTRFAAAIEPAVEELFRQQRKPEARQQVLIAV